MNRPTDFILVGMSAHLTNREFVKSKLDTYLQSFSSEGVIILNDVKGVVRDLLGDRILDSLPCVLPYTEKRLLVRNCKVAVFFWDGTDLEDFIFLSLLTGKRAKVVPVSVTRVVNKERTDQFDVYIGRGTPWGNPFAIGENGLDRVGAVDAYREYFRARFIDNPKGNAEIRTLAGKVLGCHCKPLACHGDVIASYLNSL